MARFSLSLLLAPILSLQLSPLLSPSSTLLLSLSGRPTWLNLAPGVCWRLGDDSSSPQFQEHAEEGNNWLGSVIFLAYILCSLFSTHSFLLPFIWWIKFHIQGGPNKVSLVFLQYCLLLANFHIFGTCDIIHYRELATGKYIASPPNMVCVTTLSCKSLKRLFPC